MSPVAHNLADRQVRVLVRSSWRGGGGDVANDTVQMVCVAPESNSVLFQTDVPSVSPTRISPKRASRCWKDIRHARISKGPSGQFKPSSVHRHDHGLFEEPESRPRLPALGPLRKDAPNGLLSSRATRTRCARRTKCGTPIRCSCRSATHPAIRSPSNGPTKRLPKCICEVTARSRTIACC